MTNMHDPEHDGPAYDDVGGYHPGKCPICDEVMNPAKLPDHIYIHGGDL